MDQDHIRHSVRIAAAADGRQTARVLRLRIARANPIIEVIDAIGDTIRTHNNNGDDCVEANWEAIQGTCTIRPGRRNADTLVSKYDYVLATVINT